MNSLTIGARKVGTDAPVYVVAEMSANHSQDFERAVHIVEAAKHAGADAIKIQTYTADTITIDCDNAHFRIGPGSPWEGRRLHDLYAEAFTPWEWQPKLKEVAADLGLGFFSSPFDHSAVDFLEQMGIEAYKIASFEIVDLPLIEKVGRTGKPVIISTGMASFDEIEEAVTTAWRAGASGVAVLKCTSAYPARVDELNLRVIPNLERRLDVPVGLSDHTLGITVPVAAVTLGACIVEKHFTLSRQDAGPDSSFSLEPDEFRMMVDAVRITQKALGSVSYGLTSGESSSYVFRRSLYVVEQVRAGEPFTDRNVRSIRPGDGLPPKYLASVLGNCATVDIERGTPLDWAHVANLANDAEETVGDSSDLDSGKAHG